MHRHSHSALLLCALGLAAALSGCQTAHHVKHSVQVSREIPPEAAIAWLNSTTRNRYYDTYPAECRYHATGISRADNPNKIVPYNRISVEEGLGYGGFNMASKGDKVGATVWPWSSGGHTSACNAYSNIVSNTPDGFARIEQDLNRTLSALASLGVKVLY